MSGIAPQELFKHAVCYSAANSGKESRTIASQHTGTGPTNSEKTLTKVERRTWVRYPQNRETACHPIASRSGIHWSAKIQDISATGLGLLVSQRFEPGTILAVDLHSTVTAFTRTLLVRVVHLTVVTTHASLRWIAGCAFLTPLTEDELKAML